jgi:aryl-alcohol dehydrogenase-like predicted oxidoreductase
MGRFVDRDRILEALLDTARELGVSPAAVALRWVMDAEGVTCAIFGARDVAQLDDNLAAVGLALPRDAWKALERVSRPPPMYPAGVDRFMARRRREQVERAGGSLPGGPGSGGA